jgi:hypothetical protein
MSVLLEVNEIGDRDQDLSICIQKKDEEISKQQEIDLFCGTAH